jgi:glycosyltransferase involved in cell wall biosynthesis
MSYRVAVVYGSPAGQGGLGLQAASVIAGLARAGHRVTALGPGSARVWPLADPSCASVEWIDSGPPLPRWSVKYTPLRWRAGAIGHLAGLRVGRWAVEQIARARPDVCYVFTEVGLDVLSWCKERGIPTVLDNPNGHLAGFRQVYEQEWARWCGGRYSGHPTARMVARVEREYAMADRIRVSSEWAKASMVARGVSPAKITVVDQPMDLQRFVPPAKRTPDPSKLRLLFVGSVDVRKGVFHLLRAMRAARTPTSLHVVGATGSRKCARVFAEESKGLTVRSAAGDPVPGYSTADVLVLPSLEDGFGFVVSEAMACGLPVIVTDQCGSGEWVRKAEAGWVVPAGDTSALVKALEEAAAQRSSLQEMGARARTYVEVRAGARAFTALASFVEGAFGASPRPTASSSTASSSSARRS